MNPKALAAICAMALPLPAMAADGVSVERGEQVSIFGGCHDCHTDGYLETDGKIDPAKALAGSSVGWRGPWGTTYPANLRLVARDKTEDQFLAYIRELKTRPPMPWYNVRRLDETDMRSLYQYIRSLGSPGNPVPAALAPGVEPKTPYIPVAPPVMPKT
jgi:hypothetical protein